jgi:UDPglucose 6-dehydrogenase
LTRISVIGTGYVGLVSGACFAELGHDCTCVDLDPVKVDKINRGIAPIHENGLDALLEKHVGKSLRATTDLGAAVHATDITFIAVGTPFDGQRIDLGFIRTAARQIGEALRDKDSYHVVIVKSTVVPGTTDDVVLAEIEKASGKKAGVDFGVGMNPEFLTEGVAVDDFMRPDRIVLGGIDERTIDVQKQVYERFASTPVQATNNKTAEMIKYASNSVLATMISFSNEIGNLCSALGGVDIAQVMEGVHRARYFTTTLPDGQRVKAPISSFLWAGCGYGGSCLPKDTQALSRADASARRRDRHQYRPAGAHGDAAQAPLPQPARSSGGAARPGLQGGHRRHARVARDRAGAPAAGRGRRGARLRSGGP